jgi:hypothetical protein
MVVGELKGLTAMRNGREIVWDATADLAAVNPQTFGELEPRGKNGDWRLDALVVERKYACECLSVAIEFLRRLMK